MLSHRHCVDASEIAISVNRTKFVFPKASDIGQLDVAHSATGTPSCTPPTIHAAETKHCSRTHDNHTKVVSQQRAKAKAVLQPEPGVARPSAVSRDPRVTPAGTRAAAPGASSAHGARGAQPREPALHWLPTPKASTRTHLCANTHATTNTSEGSPHTQEASRQTAGTHHIKTVPLKSGSYPCVRKKG